MRVHILSLLPLVLGIAIRPPDDSNASRSLLRTNADVKAGISPDDPCKYNSSDGSCNSKSWKKDVSQPLPEELALLQFFTQPGWQGVGIYTGFKSNIGACDDVPWATQMSSLSFIEPSDESKFFICSFFDAPQCTPRPGANGNITLDASVFDLGYYEWSYRIRSYTCQWSIPPVQAPGTDVVKRDSYSEPLMKLFQDKDFNGNWTYSGSLNTIAQGLCTEFEPGVSSIELAVPPNNRKFWCWFFTDPTCTGDYMLTGVSNRRLPDRLDDNLRSYKCYWVQSKVSVTALDITSEEDKLDERGPAEEGTTTAVTAQEVVNPRTKVLNDLGDRAANDPPWTIQLWTKGNYQGTGTLNYGSIYGKQSCQAARPFGAFSIEFQPWFASRQGHCNFYSEDKCGTSKNGPLSLSSSAPNLRLWNWQMRIRSMKCSWN